MPTLRATFQILDGFSAKVDKMTKAADKAMTTMLGASKGADKMSDSMGKTGAGADGAAKKQKKYNDTLGDTAVKASKANSMLKTLIGTMASMAAIKTGMDITDTYTNTKARLGMITSSPEEQNALQQDIFAAAGRARGNYTDMANATAKMVMLAGDTFSGENGNQEALAFTELLQKSLKVSGAGQGEQDSAFLQLTQAMAAGKLQGDEFRSVMENAPMVANAIAEYMGKSKGELKELSSQGVITSDIIKNAMFMAADDINGKFESMPMTFADVWTRIKNSGIQAFGGVFERVNSMLNSDMGQAMINNLTGAIYLAAGAANLLLDGLELIGDNMEIIGPIAWGLVAAFTAYSVVLGITKGLEMASAATKSAHAAMTAVQSAATAMQTGATFAATAAQYGFNAALMACPLTWIIGLIILLVAAFYAGVGAINQFTGANISATGLIAGAFMTMVAGVYNLGIYPLLYGLASLANFIGNVFNNPIAAVQVLFLDMASYCVGQVLNMAKAIENIINRIPGVSVDITSGLEGKLNDIKSRAAEIKDEAGWQEFVAMPKLMDYTAAASSGYSAGAGLADKASGLFSGFAPDLGGGAAGVDMSQFATGGNPATVKGTGQGGAVKVEDEEDIEWMRRLAERDYVARISQNTLAPQIRVEFSGPITKEADADNVMERVVKQMKDAIATMPEGVPQ